MADEVLTEEQTELEQQPDTGSEQVAETPPSQPDWDQTRQFRDELAAANRREGEMKATLDQMQQQLQQMNTDRTDESVPDPDLDEYDNLKTAVIQQKAQMTELQKHIAEQNKVIEQQQQLTAQQEQQRRTETGMKMLNTECDRLEKQYGLVQQRNNILNQTETEFGKAGISKLPQETQAAWIKNTLELRYRQAAEKAGSKPGSSASSSAPRKKAAVTVDTGQGGGSPSDSDEIPEGDFRTVKAALDAQYAKKGP